MNDLDRMCKCGHWFVQHNEQGCIVTDNNTIPHFGNVCGCKKFEDYWAIKKKED